MDTLLRTATEGDCRTVWEWNTHPSTRAMSFSPDPIPYADHCRWYAARMADGAARLYLLEADSVPVALARYTREGDTAALSYVVDPAYRGQGFGSLVLTLSAPCALADLAVSCIIGEALAENTASIRAMRRALFVQTSIGFHTGRPCVTLVRRDER